MLEYVWFFLTKSLTVFPTFFTVNDSDLVISESKHTVCNKTGKRQLSDDSESLVHQDGSKKSKCMHRYADDSHSNVDIIQQHLHCF